MRWRSRRRRGEICEGTRKQQRQQQWQQQCPGIRATVCNAHALTYVRQTVVPGAGCRRHGANGGGAGWMSEGARRKFIGGEWRWVGAVAEEEGVVGGRCGSGGGGGILRTPRISRQQTVYGPGQRDQDQPREGELVVDPLLLSYTYRDLRIESSFSVASVNLERNARFTIQCDNEIG